MFCSSCYLMVMEDLASNHVVVVVAKFLGFVSSFFFVHSFQHCSFIHLKYNQLRLLQFTVTVLIDRILLFLDI